MADTYKILGQALTGQLALDNTTVKETVVYEVPANTQSAVSTIQITNSSPSSQIYKLSFVKDSEVEQAYADVEYSVSTINKRFIFLMNNDFRNAYSEDAINWTEGSPLPPVVSYVSWTGLAYGNGILVGSITDTAFYTTDGINWNSTPVPMGAFTSSNVAFGNGKFVFISGNNLVASSENGITWTISSVPSSSGGFAWNQIAYGNGRFVTIHSNSSNNIYSDDGINWYSTPFPGSLSAYWRPLTYGDGKFLVIGKNPSTGEQFVLHSTDGINWNQYSLNINTLSSWSPDSLIYAEGKFVGLNYSKVIYSENGIDWSESTLPSYYGTQAGVVYGNGLFVTGANYDATYIQNYLTSTDGISWTLRSIDRPLEGYNYWTRTAYGEFGANITETQSIPRSLNRHIAIYNKTINSGETHEIKGGITLSAGDQIRAYSDSDDIIVNIYGVEIS